MSLNSKRLTPVEAVVSTDGGKTWARASDLNPRPQKRGEVFARRMADGTVELRGPETGFTLPPGFRPKKF